MGRPITAFFWKNRGFATDAGGKRTLLVKGPRTNANRELAQQRLALLLPQLATADVPRQYPNATVADVVDAFLGHCSQRVQARDMKPNTLNLFYRPYLSLIRKNLGTTLVNKVTAGTALRYRGTLVGRGLSQNTVKNHLECLRTILRWAKPAGFAVRPGADAIRAPARIRRDKLPTAAEIQAVLDAAPLDVRDVLEMLLNTPVRPGDLYALTRNAVDLSLSLLRLSDSKTGQRLVPLADRGIEILARRIRAVPRPDGRVFTTVRGRPWTIRYFAERVRNARTKAGVGPHVCAYIFRHVYTTGAFLRGLDLATVRALRGDRDAKTTLVYEHFASHLGHLQQAARRAVGQPIAATSPKTLPDQPGENESLPPPNQSGTREDHHG